MNRKSKPTSHYDITDREICTGDLLKLYHFTDGRGRKYWMYKIVSEIDGRFVLLDPYSLAFNRNAAHTCLLDAIKCSEPPPRIINGYGPGETLDYLDRPRVKKAEAESK